MSIKRCPKCRSLNVRPAYLNYVGKVFEVAAGIGVGLLTHGTNAAGWGHHVAHKAAEDKFKRNHCDSCGYEW
jgi:predicted nucleic-acid-binding Zn-ribbon protein